MVDKDDESSLYLVIGSRRLGQGHRQVTAWVWAQTQFKGSVGQQARAKNQFQHLSIPKR